MVKRDGGGRDMTIEEMKRIKKEKGYSYTQIAQMSGVPLGDGTEGFRRGDGKSPLRYTAGAGEPF